MYYVIACKLKLNYRTVFNSIFYVLKTKVNIYYFLPLFSFSCVSYEK